MGGGGNIGGGGGGFGPSSIYVKKGPEEAVDKVGQPVSRAVRSTTIDNFILK